MSKTSVARAGGAHRVSELRELVWAASTRLTSLADKYRDVDMGSGFDFATVPEMTREDVTAAAHEAATRRAEGNLASAYLFTSGGSTAEPKITWIPSGMHLDEIVPRWQPLTARDTVANLAMPGRLWSAHAFYNRLAERAGAGVVGLGHITDTEMAPWVDFLHRHGVTALVGTPTQLASVLRYGAAQGHPLLHQLRVGIWFGEACEADLLELRRTHAPGMGLWANYGSTETWVIGHNEPACDPDTFHVLPYQHVEVVGGAVLVTTLHPQSTGPVIRYRVGDRGAWVRCGCGRDGALRVLGREEGLVKFAGTLVSPQDMVRVACATPGICAAQVVILGADTGEREVMEVRVVADPRPNPGALRNRLLDAHIDLRFGLRGDEEALRIRFVDRLRTVARTAKTPVLLWGE